MSLPLHPSMARALELVRSGRLMQATEVIQAALAPGRKPAAEPNGEIIDVVAREVRDTDSVRIAPADAAQSETPDTSATPAMPNMPSAPQPARFVEGSHTEAAGTRRYKLFVPASDAPGPRPLIVMLHGCTQDADDFARGTKMNEAAAAAGLYVLYPEQAQGKNPSRCWNWFKHNHQQRGRGEPAILAGMVRAVLEKYPIDAQRIYVAGLSAGGAMAAILGETYPDLFAAVGVHSGLPTGAARDLPSALAAMKGQGAPSAASAAFATSAAYRPPIIVFHGDRDTTVHPHNGHRLVAGHPQAVSMAVETVGGESERVATRAVQQRADGVVVAEHWVLHGAGHAWSGGSALGSYTDPSGHDATAQLIRFFMGHRLKPRP